jgi:hypothetical protein
MVTAERVLPSGVDAIEVAFDDERLVADAGLLLPATLCTRLGAERTIDGPIDRPSDPGIGVGAGAKALSVVFAMLAGADSIDDTDRLRAGATGAVLGLRPRAASTAGKWLRSLGFGQVCASWTPPAGSCFGAPGAQERGPSAWSSAWTPRSPRCTGARSAAPATGTPGCSATTPSSPPRPRRAT